MLESDCDARTQSPFVSSGVSMSAAYTVIANAAKIDKTILCIVFCSKVTSVFSKPQITVCYYMLKNAKYPAKRSKIVIVCTMSTTLYNNKVPEASYLWR